MTDGELKDARAAALAVAIEQAASDKTPGLMEAWHVEVEIANLVGGGAAGETARQSFLRLCDAAAEAYRYSEPDSDVLLNHAARPLLRYLLNSLSRYAEASLRASPMTTSVAYATLARAFLYSGAAGNQAGISSEIEQATVAAYTKARVAAVDQMGNELPDADDRALLVAFKVRYQKDFNRTIHGKQMGEMAEFLAFHGHRWGKGHMSWIGD